MFCPGCGRSGPDELKFCTICGTNLESVKQALSTHIPTQPNLYTGPLQQQITPEVIEVEKARRKLKQRAVLLFAATPIWLMVMLILSEIFGDLISRQFGHFLANLAMFSMVFFVSAIMTLIYMRVMYKKTTNTQIVMLPQSQVLPTAPTMEQPVNQAFLQSELPPGRPLFADPKQSPTTTQHPLPDPILSYEIPGNESPTNKLRQPQPIPRKQ